MVSTVGGEFGVELRCAGYDGIIVSGQAEKPVYLFIKDSDVEIRDASSLWGKDVKETNALLNKECRALLKESYHGFGEWKEPATPLSDLISLPRLIKAMSAAATNEKEQHLRYYSVFLNLLIL